MFGCLRGLSARLLSSFRAVDSVEPYFDRILTESLKNKSIAVNYTSNRSRPCVSGCRSKNKQDGEKDAHV